jgi:hypothetical protein
MESPDLVHFLPYRTIDDIDLDGVVVPGLRGEFFHRPDADRTATVVRYSYEGLEVFQAWGYLDEEHCRYFAVVGADGALESPQAGCPRVRVLSDGSRIIGLAMYSATGAWLVAAPALTAV